MKGKSRQEREATVMARPRRQSDPHERRSAEEDVVVAIHEAGHGLVAVLTGRRIIRLSIVPDETSSGHILLPPLITDPGPLRGDFRAIADREALIGLAGDVAVRKYLGRPGPGAPSREDVDLAYLSASYYIGKAPSQLDAHMDGLAARANTYINLYWHVLEAVAAALLRRRMLTGREVEELVRAHRTSA
jgi:Peptidase M50B-like